MKFSPHRKNTVIRAAKHAAIYLVNHVLWLIFQALDSVFKLLLPLQSLPIAIVVTQVCVILTGLSCHVSLLTGDGHWHWITLSNLLPLLFGRTSSQTSDHLVLMQLTACMGIILAAVVGIPFLFQCPTLTKNLFTIHRLWTGNCVAAALLTPTTAKNTQNRLTSDEALYTARAYPQTNST